MKYRAVISSVESITSKSILAYVHLIKHRSFALRGLTRDSATVSYYGGRALPGLPLSIVSTEVWCPKDVQRRALADGLLVEKD